MSVYLSVLRAGTTRLVCAAAVVATAVIMVGAASAHASQAWRIDALSSSTIARDGKLEYLVQITNVGDADMNESEEVVLTGKLPAGLTAVEAKLLLKPGNDPEETEFVECKAGDGVSPVAGASEVRCADTTPVPTAQHSSFTSFQLLRLTVEASASAEGLLTSSFEVAGGGAAPQHTVDPVHVAETPPAFGVPAFDGQLLDGAGKPSTQAGAHPADVTVSMDFNTLTNPQPAYGTAWPVAPVKDVLVNLPPGFVGDPTAAERCTAEQLSYLGALSTRTACPPASQVGTILVRSNNRPLDPVAIGPFPVFNMVAPPSVPAQFGFSFLGTVVTLDASVRSAGGYGLTVSSRNISQAIPVAGTTITFWGVPSDSSHDSERACPGFDVPSFGGPGCPSGGSRRAFLRNPTSCTAPGEGLAWSGFADSWANPGALDSNDEPVASQVGEGRQWQPMGFMTHAPLGYPYPSSQWGEQVGTSGCESVPFTPSVQAQPTSTAPDSPTGLDVTIGVPQEAIHEPSETSQADLRKAVVTLPEGMTVNPAQASGLASCSLAQIGLHSTAAPSCPQESKIGSVEVETPLLEKPLKGSVYLAAQSENPFGTLLAMYIVAEGSGTVIKIPGRIDLDPATGRLTTSVDSAPQLPFSKFFLHFNSGSRAPLSNPSTCGQKSMSFALEGWNAKSITRTTNYTVNCTPGLGGFTPSFTAGTTNNQAGTFSPFLLSFSRTDGEQQISGLSFTMPPGVSAKLAGVTRCTDAQVHEAEAGAGSCPEASRIGSVIVAAGAGPDPYFLKGTVYLTGPYNGGPFGDAVVVPANAGPFKLGNVVVRGSIRIDPHTAQPMVVSDSFPQFVGTTGIPTDIKRVDVNLDRPGFTFNPTNCSELHTTGALTGSGGTVANVSSRFAASECRSLAFKPGFRVTTVAKTSRTIGASLHVTVTSGPGQANIHSVHVSLPKTLPSRLTTLQKACADRVFEVNPAACPAESRVGMATAVTPLLAARLTGPVYFVSHGGAKFPELTVVLQGEGVTVMLGGETAINEKTNVTSSTFRAVPDTPITRFDLTLPQGRFSALAATANLCKTPLVMPTRIVGQNGAVVQRNTRIAVSGCPHVPVRGKSKKASRHATNKGHGGRVGHR
jgi:hypothetical protein